MLPDINQITTLVNYMYKCLAMYLFCLTGALIRDYTYGAKTSRKVSLKPVLIYAIPCAMLATAIYDTYVNDNIKFSVWICVCVFIGMWSREIVCIMTNNKVAIIIAKLVAKNTANNIIGNISDEESEKISAAIDNVTEDVSNDIIKLNETKKDNTHPPGEFDYDDIIE